MRTTSKNHKENMVIKFGIVLFWTAFWLFNVIDKFIGGYTYFWVGRDRFAQIFKFFSSLGVESFGLAFGALIATTILEILAFVFVAAALIKLIERKEERATTLFFYGSLAGLVIFSFFAIGDQVFGDRFELLEHTIFWIAIVISWGAYIYYPKIETTFRIKDIWENHSKEFSFMVAIIVAMSIVSMVSIISYGKNEIAQKALTIEPVHIGEGVYKFDLPFRSNRASWENSLTAFIKENTHLRITEIQTIPSELKSKRDNAIFFVITEPK